MDFTLHTHPDPRMLRKIRRLYRISFPKCERKPFRVILEKQAEGSVEIIFVRNEENKLLGFAITAIYKDLVLVDYLAVSPKFQSLGIGSGILAGMKEYYRGKRIFLEIEDPEEPCDNRSDRIRRRAFYQKNGFSEAGFKVWLFGIKMPVLIADGALNFEEYHELYDEVFSPAVGKNVTKAE